MHGTIVRGCAFCILGLIYVSTANFEIGKQFEYEFGSSTGEEFYNKEGSLNNPETVVFIPVPNSIKDTSIKVLVTSKDEPKVNTTFGNPLTLTIAFDRNQLPGGFYNITAKGIKKEGLDSNATSVTSNGAEAPNNTTAETVAKDVSELNNSGVASNSTAS